MRAAARLAAFACSNAAPSMYLIRRHQQYRCRTYAASAQLISKWRSVLSQVQVDSQESSPLLQADGLRQLLKDAIHVYKTEGAAAVVPDQVTDVFMGVYDSLHTPQQKLTFFTLLAREFGVQSATVDSAVQLWQEKGHAGASPELLYRLADKLTAAAQPLYMQLLLPVSQHRTGIAFLVRLRSDLLLLLKEQPGLAQGAALRALSQDLRSALARWFSVGLLQLQRITWEDTPGQLLERVMRTEAVHRMQHMEELKRRLQQSDRRVFAFLHPSLHCEPLVVLHTAIMDHIPDNMDAVLEPQTPPPTPHTQQPDHQQQQQPQHQVVATAASINSPSCSSAIANRSKQAGELPSSSEDSKHAGSVACFYSISSGQPGLSGVDLGNFLIKKAAQLLLAELPQLQHLVTLSPTPGFRPWLITKLQVQAAAAAQASASQSHPSSSGNSGSSEQQTAASKEEHILRRHEVDIVIAAHEQLEQKQLGQQQSTSNGTDLNCAVVAAALLKLVQSHSWLQLPEEQQQALQQVLLRLCAVYLLKERRRGFALDPVEHFHLKNGAWLWRINCRADLSAAGLERSCGMMVNYKYVLADVSANNRAYLVDHVIQATGDVQQLLQIAGA